MTHKVVLFIFALWAAQPQAMSQSILIPFQLVDKLIVINATAGGQTGNFILDTGNGPLVLNANHFTGRATGQYLNGLNGRSVAVYTTRTNLIINDRKWWDREALLYPLDHLENNKGISLLGIIGTDILSDYQLTIDYQAYEISLQKAGRKDPVDRNDAGQYPEATFPFYWKDGIPVIEGRLGSEVLKLGLDTGAEINLLDSVTVREAESYFQPTGIINLLDMTRQSQEVPIGNLQNLRIADQICLKLEVAICDLAHLNQHTSRSKGDLDGVIGFEFLSQFRVTFHFKKQEIYLWHRQGIEKVLAAAE